MARTKAEIDLMRAGFICGRAEQCMTDGKGCRCNEMAARAFPYPTVTRPRRVKAIAYPGILYFYSVGPDGGLEFQYAGESVWHKWHTRQTLEDLASLLDADTLRRIADSGNCGPTEEVNVV